MQGHLLLSGLEKTFLGLGPLKTEPEAKTWEQRVCLGDDPRV